MAAQLYPLVFKPGIKRDGTPFQGEYCTDGQWVRWQRGVVRKIGGMKALNIGYQSLAEDKNYFNVLLLPSTTAAGQIYVYVMNGIGILFRTMTSEMVNEVVHADLSVPTVDTLWQSQVIIKNTYFQIPKLNANGELVVPQVLVDGGVDTTSSVILFLGCKTAADINAKSASVLRAVTLGTSVPLPGADFTAAKLDTIVASGADGGMCWSNPYLFFYGANGVVKYSNSTAPLNLTKYTTITIASDKVIFGAPIRGGSASPCMLFWTLSSVVRIANIAGNEATAPVFRIDTVSQSSSILSSRSVVEYDSVFYWVGTDRFFTYNGLVSELANTMNLNYFFNNLNMKARQQVFGVKNAKYGEIWWFYPANGSPVNNRAIIYNVRENNWYDTAISRHCGMLLEANGTMYTLGQSLTNPQAANNYLFRHEFETNELLTRPAGLGRILGGTPSSNTGLTNDNAGGGVPQNAFIQPPNPNRLYTQQRNTNLMYDYGAGNLQTISQIQVLRNNLNGTTISYHIVVQKSSDLINWTPIIDNTSDVPPNAFNPVVKSFDIVNPQPARAYRLLSDNNPLLTSSSISAFILNGTVPQQIISTGILSYFTTPIFSWASFNPMKQITGTDRWVYLQRFEPDFMMGLPPTTDTKKQEMLLVVNTRKYGQYAPDAAPYEMNNSPVTVSDPIVFNGETGKIDIMIQGRQMSFTFNSVNFFEMGHCFMLLGIGDAQ